MNGSEYDFVRNYLEIINDFVGVAAGIGREKIPSWPDCKDMDVIGPEVSETV